MKIINVKCIKYCGTCGDEVRTDRYLSTKKRLEALRHNPNTNIVKIKDNKFIVELDGFICKRCKPTFGGFALV